MMCVQKGVSACEQTCVEQAGGASARADMSILMSPRSFQKCKKSQRDHTRDNGITKPGANHEDTDFKNAF